MANILSIASSSLNAFQRALQVTGNNIANINTPGYSRQTSQFTTGPSQRFAGSYIGSGVIISNVSRSADNFANQQVRETLTTKSQYDAFYDQASQIDKLLSQDGLSVSKGMQNFFTALSQLNDSPDNIAARDVVMKQSELLTQQFNNLQNQIDEHHSNNVTQLSQAIDQVNVLTKSIAEINVKLSSQSGSPELLDQRDELIRQLSQYTSVTAYNAGDGTLNVAIGSGEFLVAGSQQRDLAVTTSTDGSKTAQIVIKSASGSGSINVTDNLNSGMLGGLMDFDKNILGQANKILGQMAVGLSTTFNAQHTLGMDLNSILGQNFFNDFNSANQQLARSSSASTNTGTGVLSVAISDISQTQLSDYELRITDTSTNQIEVLRKSDGKTTLLNWTDTPPALPAAQVNIDGLSINVDNMGNLNNGDMFTLSPFNGAAGNLKLNITKASQLAFASPVRTQAALTNTGAGAISPATIFNTTSVSKDFRIDFISDTQFNLVNVTDSITTGPVTFTPDTNNTVMIPDSLNPSYSITLSGVPKTGDQFTASYNNGGIGDNSNGLLLMNTQQIKLFEDGTTNLYDRYSGLIEQVGTQTNHAKIRNEAATILYDQAVDYRESKSGVNLDEEAANLLRYQQAYQAAGQLLAVSSQLMNFLYDAMR